jgi:hypothetical protein
MPETRLNTISFNECINHCMKSDDCVQRPHSLPKTIPNLPCCISGLGLVVLMESMVSCCFRKVSVVSGGRIQPRSISGHRRLTEAENTAGDLSTRYERKGGVLVGGS